MPTFLPNGIKLITPFGEADCYERIDCVHSSFWICFPVETGICFWFNNQEVRHIKDWSDGRYSLLPFQLTQERIKALEPLGRFHTYWRNNISIKSIDELLNELNELLTKNKN